MAGVITNGNFPKLLWPGLNTTWDAGYKSWQPMWPVLFDYNTSGQDREEDTAITGFGLARRKAEGAPLAYDSAQQTYTTTYTHVAYSLGFMITREQIDDNLYIKYGSKMAYFLGRSQAQTKDILGSDIFNSGFDVNVKYGDGVNFFTNDHPTLGGNQSNLLDAVDLSEDALENALIRLSDVRDERNLRTPTLETSLIVPPQLLYTATRILRNPERPDSTYRDINAMYTMGRFPDGIHQNIYFTDPRAYFVKTDAMDGLKYFNRKSAVFEADNDFDTKNAKYSAYERYSFGVSNWRSCFGSPGA
jgi:hypothetical protein